MRFRASIVAHYKFRKSEHYGGNSRIWPKNHSAHYSWSAIKCQRHDLRVWANSFACWRLKTPALHYYIHSQCAPFVLFFVSRDQLPFVSLFPSTLCFSLPLNILLPPCQCHSLTYVYYSMTKRTLSYLNFTQPKWLLTSKTLPCSVYNLHAPI